MLCPFPSLNAPGSVLRFWHGVPVLICTSGLSLSPLSRDHCGSLSFGACNTYTAYTSCCSEPCSGQPCLFHAAAGGRRESKLSMGKRAAGGHLPEAMALYQTFLTLCAGEEWHREERRQCLGAHRAKNCALTICLPYLERSCVEK